MNRFNLAQLFGLIGALLLASSSLLAATSFGGLGLRLIDVEEGVAWSLVALAALTILAVAVRRWLAVLILGIAAAATSGIRLSQLLSELARRTTENDYQTQQNRHWGEFFKAMTPNLEWPAWAAAIAGAVILIIVGFHQWLWASHSSIVQKYPSRE